MERSDLGIAAALEQMGGLQSQYAPSAYVGLWTRLDGFRRDDLTKALERREVVQATLLRATIHVISARDYWPWTEGIRAARRAWFVRADRAADEVNLDAAATRLRQALADGPLGAKELGSLGAGFLGRLSTWVDLVRVPPSGTWERRRADRLALAESWLGPSDSSPAEGVVRLVRCYLGAFGPAPFRDIGAWAGLPVGDVRAAGARLPLVRYRDEAGGELVDLPDAPLPHPDEPAPVRFLPHWDATLLVHARRTGLLPEAYRSRVFSTRNPFSVGTCLVDGRVVGAWSVREGRIELTPFEALTADQETAIEAERSALQAFHT
jgi:hypothetical protein